MKICIVGAGVAGIQVADTLSAASSENECHIFEKTASVGGVWRQNYDGYALQVPSELYEFPGWKHGLASGTFMDGKAVQAYIQHVVEEKSLMTRCTFHFNEEVQKLLKLDDETWSVRTSVLTSAYQKMYNFDYCVVCTGMYHFPHVPASFGKLSLQAPPIHTNDFLDASVVENKNVVVVGGGKSAIDCAVASTSYAKNVTLVQREIHWPVPRFILGLLPFKWCTYSRLGHFLLPAHWCITPLERCWHALFKPLKYLLWRLMELVFCVQFELFGDYFQMARLEIDLFNGGQILTMELRDALKSGLIKRVVTPNIEEVINEDDIVICGTGFRKDYGIFDDDTVSALDVQPDGLWLYKNILPPRVSKLAFVGSEVSTFNNILTAHLQSQWLAHQMNKPLTTQHMLTYINQDRTWKRSWMQPSASRASLIQLHMTKYHDILMEDMERPHVMTRLWEWFLPLQAEHFL